VILKNIEKGEIWIFGGVNHYTLQKKTMYPGSTVATIRFTDRRVRSLTYGDLVQLGERIR
jgi:hypothetical protein